MDVVKSGGIMRIDNMAWEKKIQTVLTKLSGNNIYRRFRKKIVYKFIDSFYKTVGK
jgi:hypothetical protein